MHHSSDLTSLSSSLRMHVYENGRRYHSLSAGNYGLPNDEVRDSYFFLPRFALLDTNVM